MGPEEPEIGATRSFAGSRAIVKLRRWLPALVTIVAVLMIARFGAYQAWPNIRYLLQDSSTSAESPAARSLRETIQAVECASEVSSKLMTLRGVTLEERDLNPGQRCLDLYYQRRNAPTHHLTFDFLLRMVSQTLTMALIGTVTATALLVATLGTTTPLKRGVQFIVGLVALTGLIVTFGQTAWLIGVVHWIEPSVVMSSDRGLAIQGVLGIFRDFSVALGISYLAVAIAKPSIRFEKAIPKVDALAKWATFFVPCILLTSGLLIVFHYRFPANFLLIDDYLGVIADPSEDQTYFSTGLPLRNWLWTYWFALIGYAAIVFAFFYAAISGFRLFANENRDSDTDETPINPAASTLHRSS